MGIVEPGHPKYESLKFRLIREATGIDSSIEHDPRTPQRSEELTGRLKGFGCVDVRYFHADALLSVGDGVRRVYSPEQAKTVVRVAGLYFPQIKYVEEAFCDFNLGANVLSDHGVSIRHVTENAHSDAWLKLLAFVAYGIKRFPESKRPDSWKHLPINDILSQATSRDIVFDDSLDHQTETSRVEVRNGQL